MENRLEEVKVIVSDDHERLECPFQFEDGEYIVNIQYSCCTFMDYIMNDRICKHINTAFLYFAKMQNMMELPRNPQEFHDKVIDTLQQYQHRFIEGEKMVGVTVRAKPARKGRPPKEKRLISIAQPTNE